MEILHHKISDTEMVKEFIDGFVENITYALGVKTFKIKFIYTVMVTVMLSPIIWISDFIRSFLIPERYFFQTIIFLCIADAVMGTVKSVKLKRFSPLLLIVGLATKLGVSYIVLQIFQAISSPQEFINSTDFRNYFILTWKLMIMTYPSLSAFNNIYYVSDKRFPPIWWMARMQNFNKDGDVDKLLGKNKNDSNGNSEQN